MSSETDLLDWMWDGSIEKPSFTETEKPVVLAIAENVIFSVTVETVIITCRKKKLCTAYDVNGDVLTQFTSNMSATKNWAIATWKNEGYNTDFLF